MPSHDPEAEGLAAELDTPLREGVLIRADNGDVVTFDETGLTLRLSDRVIEDLRHRLALPCAATAEDLQALGDIDAWGLRVEGDWLHFTARLEPGRPPRDYRKLRAGGDIIAETNGPLLAVLGLGGPRRAGFNDGAPEFAFHVLAPADDIFAVGLEGTDEARVQDGLQRLPHCPREALIADTLLHLRYQALQTLPLFFVRCETDSSPSLGALGGGQAYANFLTALNSLCAAAARLGKAAQVLAVSLDFSLEDPSATPDLLRRALRHLISRIEQDIATRGLAQPIFLIPAEAGSQQISQHPSILAHADLAWAQGRHRLTLPAPGYMFEQTRFARPTPAARLRMAEMDAHAITALSARAEWFCPQILLAEHQGQKLRVTCRAMGRLVIEDRFKAGKSCGFAVQSSGKAVKITEVTLDPSDPQALLIQLDRPILGKADLAYAFGAATPSPDVFPANRGAIRDDWQAQSRAEGGPLHRWALPALIPIQPGVL
ncbi:MAG: hypothetical protein ACOH2M_20645 [Cypionkella sp.]